MPTSMACNNCFVATSNAVRRFVITWSFYYSLAVKCFRPTLIRFQLHGNRARGTIACNNTNCNNNTRTEQPQMATFSYRYCWIAIKLLLFFFFVVVCLVFRFWLAIYRWRAMVLPLAIVSHCWCLGAQPSLLPLLHCVSMFIVVPVVVSVATVVVAAVAC